MTAIWRFEIQYGPEGEANYAWVYRGTEMVATMKTHRAREIVEAMNAAPASAAEPERLEKLEAFARSFSFSVNEASFYQDAYLKLIEPDSVTFRLGSGSQFSGFMAKLEKRRLEALGITINPYAAQT